MLNVTQCDGKNSLFCEVYRTKLKATQAPCVKAGEGTRDGKQEQLPFGYCNTSMMDQCWLGRCGGKRVERKMDMGVRYHTWLARANWSHIGYLRRAICEISFAGGERLVVFSCVLYSSKILYNMITSYHLCTFAVDWIIHSWVGLELETPILHVHSPFQVQYDGTTRRAHHLAGISTKQKCS